MTSIRHLTELLASDKVTTEERKHKYYEVIQDESERLTHLIDNLLDFARIEENKKQYKFELMNPGPYLNQIVTIFKKRVESEGFEVRVDIDEPLAGVRIDRNAMSQVVNNLLDNARKYSGEARFIEFNVNQEDNQLKFSVADKGIGIAKSELPRIFDKFYRSGDPLTRTVKGSGIGLTLVHQIVKAHEGEITVDSTPGRGSKFTVSIPIDRI